MLVDQKTDGVVVPLNYALRDVEDIPGALIVRIRESLYFGACCYKVVRSILAFFISEHLSAQRQVQRMHLASILLTLFFCTAVRLRRFELCIRREAGTSLRRATQTGCSGPRLPHGRRGNVRCIVRPSLIPHYYHLLTRMSRAVQIFHELLETYQVCRRSPAVLAWCLTCIFAESRRLLVHHASVPRGAHHVRQRRYRRDVGAGCVFPYPGTGDGQGRRPLALSQEHEGSFFWAEMGVKWFN